MEWFVDEPARGEIALTIIAFGIAAGGIWFGRRKLFLAIPAVLGFLFLAAITIPSAIPARTAAQRHACINNLRTLENAKAEWASANSKHAGDIPTDADLFGTNGTGGILRHRPICPRGGIYTIGAVGQNPTCTFSNKGHRL